MFAGRDRRSTAVPYNQHNSPPINNQCIAVYCSAADVMCLNVPTTLQRVKTFLVFYLRQGGYAIGAVLMSVSHSAILSVIL